MRKRRTWLWGVLFVLMSPIIYLIGHNWIHVKYLLRDYPYFGDEFRMIDPSKEIMHIKIGDYVADIPSNYFWRTYIFRGVWWRTSPERFEGDVVNLEVVWPGLEPWSPEIDDLFRDPGTPETISVSIRKIRNEDWPFHYLKNVENRLELVPGSNEAPGLIHYYDKLRSDDVFLEYSEPKLGMLAYDCDGENSGVIHHLCTCRHSVFIDKYNISYSFSRKYLSQWREIDLGLKKMFSSFIVTNNVFL